MAGWRKFRFADPNREGRAPAGTGSRDQYGDPSPRRQGAHPCQGSGSHQGGGKAGCWLERVLSATLGFGSSVALPACGPSTISASIRSLSRYFRAVAGLPGTELATARMAVAACHLLAAVADDVHEVAHEATGPTALSACADAAVAWDELRLGRLSRPVGDRMLEVIQGRALRIDDTSRTMWLPVGKSTVENRLGTPHEQRSVRGGKRDRQDQRDRWSRRHRRQQRRKCSGP